MVTALEKALYLFIFSCGLVTFQHFEGFVNSFINCNDIYKLWFLFQLQADEVLDQALNEIESTFDEVEKENIDSVNEEVKEAPITSAATAVEYQEDDLINLDVISNEEQEPLALDKQDIR